VADIEPSSLLYLDNVITAYHPVITSKPIVGDFIALVNSQRGAGAVAAIEPIRGGYTG
jgi:hypothetical protein